MTENSQIESSKLDADAGGFEAGEHLHGNRMEFTIDDVSKDQVKAPGANYSAVSKNFVAYTVKLPADQLAALQSIWLELKRLYGAHSPDKSGMIQHAIEEWLKRWDGPERNRLLDSLLQIRKDTRKRQYKRYL